MSELPKEWIQTSLKEVVHLNPKSALDDDLIVGFSPMAMIPTGFRGVVEFEEKYWANVKKGYTHFQDGDVLFAKVTPCFENGKAAYVTGLPNGKGAGSTEYFVLRPYAHFLDSRYLLALVKTREFLRDGALNMTGSVGLKRVPKEFVQNYPFPLAPLAEQREIAARLDTLLAQVNTLKGRLDALPAILKRFRQSVLAAAVSGKLTEEWRVENDLSPDGWEIIKIGGIVERVEAGKSLKCAEIPPNDDEYGIIKISAVTWGSYNETESKTLPDNRLFIESRRICVGDFLISRANTIELLGNPVIVHEVTKNLMLSDKVLRLVMPEDDKPWVSIFLRSFNGRKQIESRSTGNQMSMRNIGQKALLDIDIPKPLNEEQTEIVRRVEQLFAFADQVEQRVKDAQTRVNHLTQSILAKAFRGELTADWRQQHPELITGEHSAEALMARIQAERAAQTLAQTPAKRGRKKAV